MSAPPQEGGAKASVCGLLNTRKKKGGYFLCCVDRYPYKPTLDGHLGSVNVGNLLCDTKV